MQELLVFLLAMSSIALIEGHGRLRIPPARTSMWREGFNTTKNYNDAELNCGGFNFQWDYHHGKCGVCGDPWTGTHKDEVSSGIYATGIITRNYTQGQLIDVKIEITANHGGWHSFYLCPEKNLTEECFQKYLLADQNGQTKLPIRKTDKIIQLKLQLPPYLTCRQCVLRWKWVCGNRWGCDDGYKGCCLGCGKVQEQFYGCSDIAILPNGVVPPGTQKPSTMSIITSSTKKSVIKTTPIPATTLPSQDDNPWKKCPLTMICTPIGPYLPGSDGTMCIAKCPHSFCPVSLCRCSCP